MILRLFLSRSLPPPAISGAGGAAPVSVGVAAQASVVGGVPASISVIAYTLIPVEFVYIPVSDLSDVSGEVDIPEFAAHEVNITIERGRRRGIR